MKDAGLNKGNMYQIDVDATNGAKYLYDANYAGFPEGKGPEGSVGAGYWDSAHLKVGYKGTNWTPGTGQARSYLTTLSWSNSYHSSAWLAFNGSTITRVYTKHNLRGDTQVFIDGVLQTTPNDYATLTRWQVAQTWSVTSGEHIIETRRATNDGKYSDQDAFFVNVPAVGIGSYDDPTIIMPYNYIGTWTHSTCCATAYNGTISWSNTAQDAVTFTFTGTGITYVFTKAYNRGIAYITIDGGDVTPIDLYAPLPNQWQQSQFYGLSAGVHTIHIAVSGTKNPASADYYVDVDRFIVQ
jgi:hypothetical protein